MAGLHLLSIQTVTAKVQLSQSSVLGFIFLEDTQVSHGLVSDMMNFLLSQATQAQAVNQPWPHVAIAVTEKYGKRVLRKKIKIIFTI